MSLDHLANNRSVEQFSLLQSSLAEQVVDNLSKIICKPVVSGSSEASLLLSQHLGRKNRSHSFAQDVFGGRASELQTWRNISGDPLCKLPIEKWNTNLNR